ncbi:hypothetical protein Tco_0715625 [Tanacetum coccineum]
MSLLCGNSSSWLPENFHTIIEDSDSNREEIDIFFGPDDSIPPGIESDFDSEEDIIDNLLNENPIHEHLTFNIKPDAPVINNVDALNEDECFDPRGGEINVKDNDSFTFVIRTFLPFLTYPEVSPLLSSTKNEDTIYDLGISTFHFSPLRAGGISSEWNFPVLKMYGYCKNLKKTVKTRQTRTRERKSTQRTRRMLSKVNSGQLKSTFSQTWSTQMVVLMLSYSIKVMDPNSSLGKICLGENFVEISSEVEGSGDWNSLEFQDTPNSGQKKETKAMVFYQMDIEEVSDRFVAPCFVNGLEAYDGEINLGVEENMISNEYAVKLCLEHEVKRGNKVVKKELIVALRGKFYFVKFIINPEENDVEHGVILGRSFLRMTKAITDFEAGTITIYPKTDPFLEDIEEEKEKSLDDWDHLLDFNLDDVPLLGEEELSPFICKMGRSSRNKKRAMENLNFFYQDIGKSSSAGGHLTQEEAAKEALAIRMSRKFALLKEERPIIETMAYHDKYKKILDEIWKDKVELDGKIGHVNKNALADMGSNINTMPYRNYEQLGREDMKKVGVTTLIAKFLILNIPIDRDEAIVVGQRFLRTIGGIVNTLERLFLTFDGLCHQTFCAVRSDVMRNAESDNDDEEDVWKKAVSFLGSLPVPLKHVNWKLDYKGSYTKEEEEATGQWRTEISVEYGTHDDEAGSSRPNALDNMKPWKRYCFHKFIMSSCYGKDVTEIQSLVCADDELQTKKIIKFRLGRRAHSLTLLEFARRLGLYQAIELEEEGFNVYFEGSLRSDEHQNGYANVTWLIARWMKRKGAGTQKESQICCGQFISKISRKCRALTENVVRSLSALIYCRDLDTTTLRDLIDSDGKLIHEDPQSGVQRVGIPRPPRASIQDLYDSMGRMEIRQEAIEWMEYRQLYH